MTRPRVPIAVLVVLAAATTLAGAPPEPASAALRSAVTDRHLAEAVRVFGGLAQPTAEDQYLTGFALMELHEPTEAEPRLRAARDMDLRDWKGWPTVAALLERVRTFGECAPPPRVAKDPAIRVHAGAPTKWSAPVLDAIPEFAEVGRRIFGKDVPPLRLYLFSDRPTYDRFYGALFGTPVPTAWQDGTGTTNVVTYCETDREGKTTRAPGAPETVSCVLHEFGHAWCGTWLMERHGREWISTAMRRPWLDEGLADVIASLREPAFLDRRAAWLREKVAKRVAAPAFEEIADYHGFYEKGDVDVHYWTSALFVAELLGPRDRAPETIRKILDEAGRSGDAEAAVKTVTGKDLRKTFEKVVARFW